MSNIPFVGTWTYRSLLNEPNSWLAWVWWFREQTKNGMGLAMQSR
jgi:hypothetical protein